MRWNLKEFCLPRITQSLRHCEKTRVNVYCLDECSMFSWQSSFRGDKKVSRYVIGRKHE